MTIYGGDGKNWGKAAGGSTLIKTVNPFLIMEYSAKGYRHSVVKIGCEYVHMFRVPSCLLVADDRADSTKGARIWQFQQMNKKRSSSTTETATR